MSLPRWIKNEVAKRPNKFRTALVLINADQSMKDMTRQDRRDLARTARQKGSK